MLENITLLKVIFEGCKKVTTLPVLLR